MERGSDNDSSFDLQFGLRIGLYHFFCRSPDLVESDGSDLTWPPAQI